jgi:hypothetical protein
VPPEPSPSISVIVSAVSIDLTAISIDLTAISIDLTAISINLAVSYDEEGVVHPRGSGLYR